MKWKKLLSKKRILSPMSPMSPMSPINEPNDFDYDFDEIIFSKSFRQLSYKTQVHSRMIGKNMPDHIHTRLTHSLEVASVGRNMGSLVAERIQKCYPETVDHTGHFQSDICKVLKAASLLHDIGHPPFGHTGEQIIRDFFAQSKFDDVPYIDEFRSFDSNAQILRIATNSQLWSMDLSYAVLGACLKYPFTSSASNIPNKFCVFTCDIDFMRSMAGELCLKQLSAQTWARHPLAYLLEAADDICYMIVDVQDAADLGVPGMQNELEKLAKSCLPNRSLPASYDPKWYRKHLMMHFVELSVRAFMENYQQIMAGEYNMKHLLQVPALNELRHKMHQDVYVPSNGMIEQQFGTAFRKRLEDVSWKKLSSASQWHKHLDELVWTSEACVAAA